MKVIGVIPVSGEGLSFMTLFFLRAQGLNIAENSMVYFGSLIIQNNWDFLMIQIKILFLDNG